MRIIEIMKKILIRFDDICPTMDWDQWERAMTIMNKYNVKPLIGVIPDCQDKELMIDIPRKDFWEYIRYLQSQGFSIAMHGYNHVFDTKTRGIINDRFCSEFAGHSYEEQYEKIRKGKEILVRHGIDTDVFFAPAHSYNEITLKALAANGFRYVFDGKSIKPMMRDNVICIPCDPPKLGKKEYQVMVFHAHEWIRPDKMAGYKELVDMCRTQSDYIVDMKTYLLRPLGNSSVQLLLEKVFVLYGRSIKPILRKIKKSLMGK